MVLEATLLNTQYYKVRTKGKVEQSRKWSSPPPPPTLRCCSYWKGSLQVALDYGRQLYLYGFKYSYLMQITCTVIVFRIFWFNIICKQIYLIRTVTIIMGQSGPGSNGNKLVTPHYPILQGWSNTIRCNLVSYSEGPLFWRSLRPMQWTQSSYSRPRDTIWVSPARYFNPKS